VPAATPLVDRYIPPAKLDSQLHGRTLIAGCSVKPYHSQVSVYTRDSFVLLSMRIETAYAPDMVGGGLMCLLVSFQGGRNILMSPVLLTARPWGLAWPL
jgi:hypothetical protein